jgi:hypothetical protein
MSVPRETPRQPAAAFLTLAAPHARAPRPVEPDTITDGARVVLVQPDGHWRDWRAVTNPFWYHPPTGATWAVGAQPPAEIADQVRDSDEAGLFVDVVPEAEWYEWKTHGDVQPHPLRHATRLPSVQVYVE